MLWLFLSILSAVSFAFVNLLMRIIAVKSVNQRLFSLVYNLWGAFFALILFIFELPTFQLKTSIAFPQILLILLAVISYGLFERLQFTARKHIEVSAIVIILRLSPVVAFIGSIIFLKESLSLMKIVGAGLIILASILISYKNTHFKINRNFFIALFCAFVLGIGWMLDKPASKNLPAGLYSFIMWLLPLVIIAFPKISLADFSKEAKIGSWKVAFVAFLNVFAYFINLKALSLADVSQVIPIISSSAILAILLGIILLGERSYLIRKLVAGIIAFIGILILS